MSKSKEVALSAEQLAVLDGAYPIGENTRVSFPRFGMLSKDLTEETGKGKSKVTTVIEAAGTYFTESDNGEIDEETGKKVWTKEFIGENPEVIIAFERKQLRKYDNSLNKFISSAVYDTPEQIIPLYLDKQIIKRGTPVELQAMYPALTQKGKASSDLKEDRILYVIYKGTMYQWTLSTSSKWSFSEYKRIVGNPSKVTTELSSLEETNGSNVYRKSLFKSTGVINAEELDLVMESQSVLRTQVESDAARLLETSKNEVIEADEISLD